MKSHEIPIFYGTNSHESPWTPGCEEKPCQIGDSEEHGSDQFHHLLIGKATFRDSLAVVVLVEGQGSTKEDSYWSKKSNSLVLSIKNCIQHMCRYSKTQSILLLGNPSRRTPSVARSQPNQVSIAHQQQKIRVLTPQSKQFPNLVFGPK